MKHLASLLLAIACLLAGGCGATRPMHTSTITIPARGAHHAAVTVFSPPTPSRTVAGHHANPRSPIRSARMVAAAFAAAYPRYLTGRLSARRLPGLSPAALTNLEQTRPLSPRQRVIHLRLLTVNGADGGWSITYTASVGVRRTTIADAVTLVPGVNGWQITHITPPDLDQLIAADPVAPVPPSALRAAAVAFTRSYLAYTYAYAPAASLTHLTAHLREQLAARPPTVPAAIRALHPQIINVAFARLNTTVWLAIAQITDGPDQYTIQSTVAHTGRGWTAIHVTAGD
jgi:hypothetical protein